MRNMSKTTSIHVRVTRQQKELIKNNAKASGYTYVADYMRIRSMCFLACEEKLNKLCKLIIPEETNKVKLNGANKKLAEFI